MAMASSYDESAAHSGHPAAMAASGGAGAPSHVAARTYVDPLSRIALEAHRYVAPSSPPVSFRDLLSQVEKEPWRARFSYFLKDMDPARGESLFSLMKGQSFLTRDNAGDLVFYLDIAKDPKKLLDNTKAYLTLRNASRVIADLVTVDDGEYKKDRVEKIVEANNALIERGIY
jgi:hypothetical protein